MNVTGGFGVFMHEKKQFVVSYSGGKDSTLALYHMLKTAQPVGLIMMLEEEGQRSRSHGMDMAVIQAQAQSLGLPVISAASGWGDYESHFMDLLQQSKQLGAEMLVTGDLDVPEHESWHEKVAAQADLKLCMPLKNRGHREVVDEFIALGFVALVVTVNLSLGMRASDLGRAFTAELVCELEERGIDPCGEGGEFHTTVVDGPIFATPIEVVKEAVVYHGEYAFMPLGLGKPARNS